MTTLHYLFLIASLAAVDLARAPSCCPSQPAPPPVVANESPVRSPTPVSVRPRLPRPSRRRLPRADQRELLRTVAAQSLRRYKSQLQTRYLQIADDGAALVRRLALARACCSMSGIDGFDSRRITEAQARMLVLVALKRGCRLTGQYACGGGCDDQRPRRLFEPRRPMLSDLLMRAEKIRIDIHDLLQKVILNQLTLSDASYTALEELQFKIDMALVLNLEATNLETAVGVFELFDLKNALRSLPALKLRP